MTKKNHQSNQDTSTKVKTEIIHSCPVPDIEEGTLETNQRIENTQKTSHNDTQIQKSHTNSSISEKIHYALRELEKSLLNFIYTVRHISSNPNTQAMKLITSLYSLKESLEEKLETKIEEYMNNYLEAKACIISEEVVKIIEKNIKNDNNIYISNVFLENVFSQIMNKCVDETSKINARNAEDRKNEDPKILEARTIFLHQLGSILKDQRDCFERKSLNKIRLTAQTKESNIQYIKEFTSSDVIQTSKRGKAKYKKKNNQLKLINEIEKYINKHNSETTLNPIHYQEKLNESPRDSKSIFKFLEEEFKKQYQHKKNTLNLKGYIKNYIKKNLLDDVFKQNFELFYQFLDKEISLCEENMIEIKSVIALNKIIDFDFSKLGTETFLSIIRIFQPMNQEELDEKIRSIDNDILMLQNFLLNQNNIPVECQDIFLRIQKKLIPIMKVEKQSREVNILELLYKFRNEVEDILSPLSLCFNQISQYLEEQIKTFEKDIVYMKPEIASLTQSVSKATESLTKQIQDSKVLYNLQKLYCKDELKLKERSDKIDSFFESINRFREEHDIGVHLKEKILFLEDYYRKFPEDIINPATSKTLSVLKYVVNTTYEFIGESRELIDVTEKFLIKVSLLLDKKKFSEKQIKIIDDNIENLSNAIYFIRTYIESFKIISDKYKLILLESEHELTSSDLLFPIRKHNTIIETQNRKEAILEYITKKTEDEIDDHWISGKETITPKSLFQKFYETEEPKQDKTDQMSRDIQSDCEEGTLKQSIPSANCEICDNDVVSSCENYKTPTTPKENQIECIAEIHETQNNSTKELEPNFENSQTSDNFVKTNIQKKEEKKIIQKTLNLINNFQPKNPQQTFEEAKNWIQSMLYFKKTTSNYHKKSQNLKHKEEEENENSKLEYILMEESLDTLRKLLEESLETLGKLIEETFKDEKGQTVNYIRELLEKTFPPEHQSQNLKPQLEDSRSQSSGSVAFSSHEDDKVKLPLTSMNLAEASNVSESERFYQSNP